MKALLIITTSLAIALGYFAWDTENKFDQLNYRYEELANKQSKMSGIEKDIEMLQEKVYYDMIGKGKEILMEKLDVLSDRIYFVEIHYSTDGSYIKSIEYMISGDCSTDKRNYTCENYFVDVNTGVISKF